MERVIINIGDKTYKCQIAKNEEDRRKGLQGIEHLPIDEGMLFVWEDEGTREMWMKDCSLELDIIGINDDDELAMPLVGYGTDDNNAIVGFDRHSFIQAMTDSGITERISERIIDKMVSSSNKWSDIIDSSFLNDKLKSDYKSLIQERIKRIEKV